VDVAEVEVRGEAESCGRRGERRENVRVVGRLGMVSIGGE
jgi:hypothetical protein